MPQPPLSAGGCTHRSRGATGVCAAHALFGLVLVARIHAQRLVLRSNDCLSYPLQNIYSRVLSTSIKSSPCSLRHTRKPDTAAEASTTPIDSTKVRVLTTSGMRNNSRLNKCASKAD